MEIKLWAMQAGTIVILPDRGSDWSATLGHFASCPYRVVAAASAGEVANALDSLHVDVVIVEDQSGESAGLDLLTRLRDSHPDVARIYVRSPSEPATPGALDQASLYLFLHAPLDPLQAGLVVERALESQELVRRHRAVAREFKSWGAQATGFKEREGAVSRLESRSFEKLVYASEKMTDLCDLARQAAATNLPILIQGEAGTGKELLARAIHYNSPRSNGPLRIVHCVGMPDEHLQVELFGDARESGNTAPDHRGALGAAEGGTVLLSEVACTSPALQARLLHFMQHQEACAVPAHGDSKRGGARVIASTSGKPLRSLVECGEFRQDLYFHLKGFELEMPPLRERPDDIAPLAEFFTAKHADAMGRNILGITANAIDKLALCTFPGNVLELENEIRRMVALAGDGEYLTTRTMSPDILRQAAARKSLIGSAGSMAAGTTLKDQVENLEKQVVGLALLRNRWNQSRAAAELGLSRVGLANKIKRYRLDENG